MQFVPFSIDGACRFVYNMALLLHAAVSGIAVGRAYLATHRVVSAAHKDVDDGRMPAAVRAADRACCIALPGDIPEPAEKR